MDSRIAEVVHRMVVAVVVLEGLRVVTEQIGCLLDLAERLEARLAHLDRHQAAVDHLALADQLGRLADDRQAIAPRRCRPGGLRLASGFDRVADILAGAPREVTEDEIPVDRRGDGRLAVADALTAADEVAVVAVELALGLGQARLVKRVQLLVVGAERRVGDLQAGLGLGRHRRETSVEVGGNCC